LKEPPRMPMRRSRRAVLRRTRVLWRMAGANVEAVSLGSA
jgi:hypothetical protein